MRVLEVEIDNATKATVGVLGILQPNVDYSIGVSPDIDSGGSTVLIRPLRPLDASTGATNNGYLVLVTNGVTSSTGVAATPDAEYLTVRTAAIADLTGGVSPADLRVDQRTRRLNGVCRLTYAHLAIGSLLPGPFAVARRASWPPGVSRPSRRATRWRPRRNDRRQALRVLRNRPDDSVHGAAGIRGHLRGHAQHRLPPCSACHDNLDERTDATVAGSGSLGVTIDRSDEPQPDALQPGAGRRNGASTSRCSHRAEQQRPKPATGWPVVIFVHGFPRNRTDALLVSDTMASRGFATIAIDMPLHGVTPIIGQRTSSRSRRRSSARSTSTCRSMPSSAAPGQDGRVDPTGVNFLNLTNVLVQRDNLRQAIADIIALVRTHSDDRLRRRTQGRTSIPTAST